MKEIKDKNISSGARQMLNKVPEITLYFWVIKVLCTTVGETAADFLNETLNLGLDGVTLIIGTILAVTLVFQFKSKKYIPGIYWLAVVLISIVGTLITDNLTDNLGVSLETSTAIFAVSLAVIFATVCAFNQGISCDKAWQDSVRSNSIRVVRSTVVLRIRR